jgi:uncharacterized protein with von Willebrand factor type A (vWA) domain
MDLTKESPVGPVAHLIAKAANLSGLLQALAVGALPTETIEGLLVAAETAIVVQLAVGALDTAEADALRTKIADWGRSLIARMEADGTAEEIRKHHAKTLEEYRRARESDGDGPN